jgi:hypothetical protein
METHHVVMLVVVGIAAYLLGAKYPGWAQRFGF